jgi:hypothetical protein
VFLNDSKAASDRGLFFARLPGFAFRLLDPLVLIGAVRGRWRSPIPYNAVFRPGVRRR